VTRVFRPKFFRIFALLFVAQIFGNLLGCGQAAVVRFRDPIVNPLPPSSSDDVPLGDPTFAKIKQRIFVRSCYACHSVGHRAEKVPLDTVEDLLYSPETILVPGKSDESSLYLTLIGADEDMLMPPLKSTVPRVSPEEIAWIKRWIDEGAKE
jgi:uncharacterized membrane protein